MAPYEEAQRLIEGLPDAIRKALFAEFDEENRKLESWTNKASDFVGEMSGPPPGEKGFGDAISQWSRKKADGVRARMVDRLLIAIRAHYGAVPISKDDIRAALQIMLADEG